ncbi:MAG: ComF family protein [Ignavibacteriae bacterium]|nr:ComF family protein [Ignavibacteriota bacterium]
MPIPFLRTTLTSLREMVAPSHCELCGKYMGSREERMKYVCNSCLDSLDAPPTPKELFKRVSRNFTNDDLSFASIFSLVSAEHDSPIMELLYSMKYRGISRIGYEFGKEIGETLRHLGLSDFEMIIPVPIHKARKRERGYNQSDYIASGISQVLGIPLVLETVIRSRYTTSQTTLSAAERKVNVLGAFAAGRNKAMIKGKKLLLVDDVFTTGTTLNSCATALLEIGALRVDVATLAAAA